MNTALKFIVSRLSMAYKPTENIATKLHNVLRTQSIMVVVDKNEHIAIRTTALISAITLKSNSLFNPCVFITSYGFVLAKDKKKAFTKRFSLGVVITPYVLLDKK